MYESLDALRGAQNHEQKLWIPGTGEVDVRVRAAQRVVQEEDERLVLARHEITGDWVIFITLDDRSLFPVVGIGPELPPNAEDVRALLHKYDAKRHGDKILRDINAKNERLRMEQRAKRIEADGDVAEHLLWGFRKEGVVSPQVFIPSDL